MYDVDPQYMVAQDADVLNESPSYRLVGGRLESSHPIMS